LFVEVVLGPVAADAVKVERGEGEAEHHGHLGDAHDSHKSAAQIGERALNLDPPMN
jgi:hypothetical protein